MESLSPNRGGAKIPVSCCGAPRAVLQGLVMCWTEALKLRAHGLDLMWGVAVGEGSCGGLVDGAEGAEAIVLGHRSPCVREVSRGSDDSVVQVRRRRPQAGQDQRNVRPALQLPILTDQGLPPAATRLSNRTYPPRDRRDTRSRTAAGSGPRTRCTTLCSPPPRRICAARSLRGATA